MNKKVLENFITKYNLAGSVDAVSWKADSKGVSVYAASDERNVIVSVSTDQLQLPDGVYDIFETSQLRSLISVLGDDLDWTVLKGTDGSPIAFVVRDGSTKVKFVLADSSVIPVAPTPKGMPDWDVVIKLDSKFLNTFSKAAGAMRDAETFTVVSDGQVARVVIGYSDDNNQNSVTIEVETTENGIMSPVRFSSKYLREILHANKDMTAGKMEVSEKGITHLTFDVDGFKAGYFLNKIDG